MSLEVFFLSFVPIFVAVDAIGMVPLFMSLTEGLGATEKNKLLRNSVLTALTFAVLFLWLGRLVFSWLGITISDFLVAGGAILFIISIRDLLSSGKPSVVTAEGGVVPLAVPLIVGPAVLTSSLIVLNTYGAVPTLFSLIVNILLCGLILRYSQALSQRLGHATSLALSKISSLLLGAIGVMLMRRGLFEIWALFRAQ